MANKSLQIERAWAAHEKFLRVGREAVGLAIQAGALLMQARENLDHGQFQIEYEAAGFKKATVYNYIAVAERWDGKQLKDGVKLCDLYRDAGIMRPLQGGGQRLGKFEIQRRNAARQLIFNFEVFEIGIKEAIRFDDKNPFQDIARDQLKETRAHTARALELMDEALNTIDS